MHHQNSNRYYFVLENRISVQMGPSPIQLDIRTEIKNITNNFGPNFVKREHFSWNHAHKYWRKILENPAVKMRWLFNLCKWLKSGGFSVFRTLFSKGVNSCLVNEEGISVFDIIWNCTTVMSNFTHLEAFFGPYSR